MDAKLPEDVFRRAIDSARIAKVENADLFFALIETIRDEDPETDGFHNNRAHLLEGMIRGDLYTMLVRESDELYEIDNYLRDPRFLRNLGYYVPSGDGAALPCMALVKRGPDGEVVADIVWVHSCIRRMGIGTAMVQQLRISKADNIMDEARAFWAAVL